MDSIALTQFIVFANKLICIYEFIYLHNGTIIGSKFAVELFKLLNYCMYAYK